MVEEILNWAGDGEDDMAFKYNILIEKPMRQGTGLLKSNIQQVSNI